MQKIPNRFKCIKTMPPLKHDINPKQSDVIKWLIDQPEVLNYIFDAIRGNGRRESPIIYNHETGTWQGVDYHAD